MKITPIPMDRRHGRFSLLGRSFPRTTGLIAAAILGLSGLPQSARAIESRVATACHTAGGALAKIEAIDTTLMKAATGDLPFILVTDKLNGARVRIYHDPDLAAAALRVTASLGAAGQKAVAPDMLAKFATTARRRMRIEGGGYRREHVRALAQRFEVDVDVGEVRILGSKSNLLQALLVGAAETKPGAVPSFVPKWCTRLDSNQWPPD